MTHRSILFHPELDLLYITEWTPFLPGPTALIESLEACGALNRVKSIACSSDVGDSIEYMYEFRRCTNLELFLPVWNTEGLQTPYFRRTQLLGFHLEDVEATLSVEYEGIMDLLRVRDQRLLARDGGVTPFLREVKHVEVREEF